MPFGICSLSLIAVKEAASDSSELITQLLYGDHYKVIEERKHWKKIRIPFDRSEGWIKKDQHRPIEEEVFKQIETSDKTAYSLDLVSFINNKNSVLIPILLGSCTSNAPLLAHTFEGSESRGIHKKEELIETALFYLNAPELAGGKSPFGIDNAGFTQMVYKINGYKLNRKSGEQAMQGEALSFIEESEPGDLAFFDDKEGNINHVGIIMRDNYIIHVHGNVRIDRLDHTGIFNTEKRQYTHPLRVIKKII